ncbi:acyltransferase-like protein At1g54570, chloroplastic isoform X3 [Helianthus annuus]|uniref:acyltransferase-like protein At1g54570, chloroplastic isoform X3 n=1 Tax=Helianthus annuus TaxID=4232 RepID=UPI001652D5EF|nr:acyltransferase-like protein At1g54570, chloroplastic isoform X3 [Helianthus annuus]
MTVTLRLSGVPLSFPFNLNEKHRLQSRVHVRSVGNDDSPESIRISGVSSVNKKDAYVAAYDVGGKKSRQDDHEELKVFWDDGFGTQTTKDLLEMALILINSDGGPPRWFCPIACGKPIKDSPVLLYLPGIDGTGAGLVIHEKTLGKVFNVQCLHIPVWDRTPLEGLIHIVEEIVMIEHTLSPNKPIYLLGESFGGALALCVAARNPTVDLILILANPADYIKISMIKFYGRNYVESLWQLLVGFSKDQANLSVMLKILPKDTLTWRVKLVRSAAAYANSRLHAITSQVLVLASGRDNILPSIDEARRLLRLLKHCDVRVFADNGHTILLESGVNVLSAIKTTYMYRRSSKHDILKDYLPASITEFKTSPVESWWFRLYIDAVMFSTMEDGKIVRGLAGIPDEGPVLIVGNHMLMAFDVFPLIAEFLREKKITLHGLSHPELFDIDVEHEYYMIPIIDLLKLGGSIPISGRNLFKLLEKKSHVLLYPGGIREALHRKGEAGKLFWPDKQEFVRMAVRFGATIIPYGSVGEDDILELIVDYNDMKRNPLLNYIVNEFNQGKKNLREGVGGEIAKQPFHIPIVVPKPPGRVYFKFGKPIRTKGKEHMLYDYGYLQELYLQVRSDVEKNIAYLLKKRKEDPYRSGVQRLLWQMKHGSLDQIPSFDP